MKYESKGPKKAPSKVGELVEALPESDDCVPVHRLERPNDRYAESGEHITEAGMLSCDTVGLVAAESDGDGKV